MAPEPQPTSNISIGCCTFRYSSITFDTNSSVSGLGMNTVGAVFKVKSMKSHSPNIYCKGIRAQRASQRRENSECCSAMRLIVQLRNEVIYSKLQLSLTLFAWILMRASSRCNQDNSSVLANGGFEIIKSNVLPLSGFEHRQNRENRFLSLSGQARNLFQTTATYKPL
uniref:Uncharacterized protein n=1 Tax=Glossina austeni TaxID=7395 RepID=A0A1A9V1C4_GLOAU